MVKGVVKGWKVRSRGSLLANERKAKAKGEAKGRETAKENPLVKEKYFFPLSESG